MSGMEDQETNVSLGRTDELVYIYTTHTVHLKKLRGDPRVAEIKGGEDWGQFTVPSAIFDPLTGFRRAKRAMTQEQRDESARRLVNARKAKEK